MNKNKVVSCDSKRHYKRSKYQRTVRTSAKMIKRLGSMEVQIGSMDFD